MVFARSWGGGENGEVLVKGYKVSVRQHEEVLEICYIARHLQLTILCCILKNLLKRVDLKCPYHQKNDKRAGGNF